MNKHIFFFFLSMFMALFLLFPISDMDYKEYAPVGWWLSIFGFVVNIFSMIVNGILAGYEENKKD